MAHKFDLNVISPAAHLIQLFRDYPFGWTSTSHPVCPDGITIADKLYRSNDFQGIIFQPISTVTNRSRTQTVLFSKTT